MSSDIAGSLFQSLVFELAKDIPGLKVTGADWESPASLLVKLSNDRAHTHVELLLREIELNRPEKLPDLIRARLRTAAEEIERIGS